MQASSASRKAWASSFEASGVGWSFHHYVGMLVGCLLSSSDIECAVVGAGRLPSCLHVGTLHTCSPPSSCPIPVARRENLGEQSYRLARNSGNLPPEGCRFASSELRYAAARNQQCLSPQFYNSPHSEALARALRAGAEGAGPAASRSSAKHLVGLTPAQ